MKFLLATLLSFIMMEAPVLALHGGYSLGASTDVGGQYAGVLIPTSDTLLVASATDFGSNALGLFTLSIPNEDTTGLGSGSAVIFSNGQTFTGAIQAVPDPDSNTGGIIGILNATFNYTFTETEVDAAGDLSTVSSSVTASAQGSFDASVEDNTNAPGGLGVSLDGTSEVSVNQGFVSGSTGTPIISEQITFAIEGFQQSSVASTTSGT
jgi:hypothetical protein